MADKRFCSRTCLAVTLYTWVEDRPRRLESFSDNLTGHQFPSERACIRLLCRLYLLLLLDGSQRPLVKCGRWDSAAHQRDDLGGAGGSGAPALPVNPHQGLPSRVHPTRGCRAESIPKRGPVSAGQARLGRSKEVGWPWPDPRQKRLPKPSQFQDCVRY